MTAAWSKPPCAVGALADAERGGEFAHRVVVARRAASSGSDRARARRRRVFRRSGVSADRVEGEESEFHPALQRQAADGCSIHIMSATIAGHMSLQIV